MEKVLIIGCSGSGKSTLARELARRSGLPVIYLDQHYWLPGWVEHDEVRWPVKVASLTAGPRWIIEGNYSGTLGIRLAAADTVIWFDLPRHICMWRVLRRTASSFGRVREEMAPGCPERWDWGFLSYVWNFNRDHRPRLVTALEGFQGKRITVRHPRDANAFLTGELHRSDVVTSRRPLEEK